MNFICGWIIFSIFKCQLTEPPNEIDGALWSRRIFSWLRKWFFAKSPELGGPSWHPTRAAAKWGKVCAFWPSEATLKPKSSDFGAQSMASEGQNAHALPHFAAARVGCHDGPPSSGDLDKPFLTNVKKPYLQFDARFKGVFSVKPRLWICH